MNTPSSDKRSFSKFYLGPALVLATVLSIDYFFIPSLAITPICCLLILGLLAMYAPLEPMLFWTFVCTAVAAYVIFNPDVFAPATHSKLTGHIAHVISEGVYAGIALLLCVHRVKVQEDAEVIQMLVRQIPMPIILSNANGEIAFINEQAAQILGVSRREAMGDSYFRLVMDPNAQGVEITKYLNHIDSKETAKEWPVELKPRKKPGVTLHGTAMKLEGGRSSYLLTILSQALPEPA